jgi:endoglucanase
MLSNLNRRSLLHRFSPIALLLVWAMSQPAIAAPLPPVSTPVSTPASPTCAAKASPMIPGIAPLQSTWDRYRQRFIENGRVIDRERPDQHSTSEGQAYALLRSVMINDPKTFGQVLAWSEANLKRPTDRLWSWQWAEGQVKDANFASDGDIDAIVALILAGRRWGCPAYLDLARAKLASLWDVGTLIVTVANGKASERILLPGARDAFVKTDGPEAGITWNPSYSSPHAYRLFAQVDPGHDWTSLIGPSYRHLNAAFNLSSKRLPADWLIWDPKTDLMRLRSSTAAPLSAPVSNPSLYSFDAIRTWWRLSLDAQWFNEPRAKQLLQTGLSFFAPTIQKNDKVFATYSLDGTALVDYEATAHYAMLASGFQAIQPALAKQIQTRKLTPKDGMWDNDRAYYSNNLVWLSRMPKPTPNLLRP